MEVGGADANNLRDERDQLISQLSEYIGVTTISREYGVVDVSIAEMPVVMGAQSRQLEIGLDENDDLSISIVDAYSYTSDVTGGKLGGLLALKNTLISDIHTDLDSLAVAIIQQINQYHVEGVGSAGSFGTTGLTGWANESGDLADFTGVSNGNVYIRVTNTSTDAITRTAVAIDTADTLSDVATNISAVTGVTATVNSSNQLTITADANYEFDFIPAVLPSPATTDFDGTAPPTVSVSGIYTESDTETLTFAVSGDGAVGNGTLQLVVTGSVTGAVATLNIGSGYAAGEKIAVGDTGISIALTVGDLDETTDADNFTVDVLADTDTSGVLAAVGINTFFSGTNASDMAVCSDISSTPGRIAAALGGDKTDNVNISRLIALQDTVVSSLSNLSPGEFYRRMVADIGQDLSIKQVREANIEVILQNLVNRRSELSGIDINEEAISLLVFEQMFQAVARYMNTIQEMISSLMQMV